MTEDQLLRAVLELCRYRGLMVHHCRPARTINGWRTPVQGNPGFPDLVIAGPGGVAFVELKAARGRLSPTQQKWGDTLIGAGAPHFVLRPAHLRDGTVAALVRQLASEAVRH